MSTLGLCSLHNQGNPVLGQQQGPKRLGLKAISLLRTLQALEINQASVSQF